MMLGETVSVIEHGNIHYGAYALAAKLNKRGGEEMICVCNWRTADKRVEKKLTER